MTAGDEQQADAQPPESALLTARAFAEIVLKIAAGAVAFCFLAGDVIPGAPPPVDVLPNGAVFVHRGGPHWLVPHPLAALGTFVHRATPWVFAVAFACVLTSAPIYRLTKEHKHTRWDQRPVFRRVDRCLTGMIAVLVVLAILVGLVSMSYPDPIFRLFGSQRLPSP